MPIYELQCKQCGKTREVITKSPDLAIKCKCGGVMIIKVSANARTPDKWA